VRVLEGVCIPVLDLDDVPEPERVRVFVGDTVLVCDGVLVLEPVFDAVIDPVLDDVAVLEGVCVPVLERVCVGVTERVPVFEGD
jgi:hypothetical protein